MDIDFFSRFLWCGGGWGELDEDVVGFKVCIGSGGIEFFVRFYWVVCILKAGFCWRLLVFGFVVMGVLEF